LPCLLDQTGRSSGTDQLDLGHGEAGTVNDLDERDGLTQGFGEDDAVECGEKRVLSGQLAPVRELDRHVDCSPVVSTIDKPFENIEPESHSLGFDPGSEDQLGTLLDGKTQRRGFA